MRWKRAPGSPILSVVLERRGAVDAVIEEKMAKIDRELDEFKRSALRQPSHTAYAASATKLAHKGSVQIFSHFTVSAERHPARAQAMMFLA